MMIFLLIFISTPVTFIAQNIEGVAISDVSKFNVVIFYYGWVNTSNLLDLEFDILVFGASEEVMNYQYDVIDALRSRGVQVYAYLHDGDTPIGLGSSFREKVVENNTGTLDERVTYWKDYIKGLINKYVGKVDGVFLDECDPSYFGTTDPNNEYLQLFSQGLEEIVNYAHGKGLKVFINGVRAYANLGDYYLWEDFVAVYDNANGYHLDTEFYSTSSDNPYEWVNGIAKYEYLKENELLSKTIALSYADLDHLENAKYGYYMARILGLAGWAFSDIKVYYEGGIIPILDVYEVGPAITPPNIDKDSERATRVFMTGEVVVDLATPSLSTPFNNYKPYILDGKPLEYDNLQSATGSQSELKAVGYASTPRGLQVYIEASWSSTDIKGPLHIYIDSDGNQSTGYGGKGNYGAEYLIEMYSPDSIFLYKYTGTGGWDWSWTQIGTIDDVVYIQSDTSVIVEMLIPSELEIYEPGVSKLSVTTTITEDSSYADDTICSNMPIGAVEQQVAPTIYDSENVFKEYRPVIIGLEIKGKKVTFTADAPSGTLATYTIYIPFTKIAKVTKNGSPLPGKNTPSFSGEGYYVKAYDNYAEVIIRALHESSVTITIYGVSGRVVSLGGEPVNRVVSVLPYVMLISALSITILYSTKRKS